MSRYGMLLVAPLIIISLLAQIGLYVHFLPAFPKTWLLLLISSLLLFGILALLLLNTFSRWLFAQADLPQWMLHTVARLSHELGMRQPALYALSSEGINAFALGGDKTGGAVYFHKQVISQLTQDEVEAVLAHELAHLSAGHAMLMTFLQGMTAPLLAPVVLCISMFIAVLFGLNGFRQYFIQLYHVLNVVLFPLTSVLIALVMRYWEYSADAQAAQLVGKAKYISALQCLHGSFFQQPDLLNLSSGRPLPQHDQWALSHPRLKQRIQALRELGTER